MVIIQDIRNKVAPSKTKRKISQITKIARHHSATTSGDYFTFWNHWKSKGWTKGGYAEIILLDGTVQLCYDPIYPTNGIGNHNTNTDHICVVGNGAFTAAQERAFEERCLLAMTNFGLGVEDVLGHNEFKGTATTCPGINMDSVRKRLSTLLEPKKEVKPVTVTKGLFRIKTGTFPNARAFADAIEKVKQDFGMLIYEAADTTSYNPNYRIYTGTFTTKEDAEEAEAKLKYKYGWTTYLIDETK
ncbi:N-acetylmuramoyl-L-alanine amidase [Psychrobacillus sp. FSL K6-2836]|uniref:N-acetylmuramoyl-L-alanine amidase n=1 Tax=Psychrobacillus sp. FSL K6-2836 TaxID=2921548 RepID=UPI0030F5D385